MKLVLRPDGFVWLGGFSDHEKWLTNNGFDKYYSDDQITYIYRLNKCLSS